MIQNARVSQHVAAICRHRDWEFLLKKLFSQRPPSPLWRDFCIQILEESCNDQFSSSLGTGGGSTSIGGQSRPAASLACGAIRIAVQDCKAKSASYHDEIHSARRGEERERSSGCKWGGAGFHLSHIYGVYIWRLWYLQWQRYAVPPERHSGIVVLKFTSSSLLWGS